MVVSCRAYVIVSYNKWVSRESNSCATSTLMSLPLVSIHRHSFRHRGECMTTCGSWNEWGDQSARHIELGSFNKICQHYTFIVSHDSTKTSKLYTRNTAQDAAHRAHRRGRQPDSPLSHQRRHPRASGISRRRFALVLNVERRRRLLL
jgi:hypothetical protein